MDYQKHKEQLLDLINQSCLAQERFFQHILLVSATILGIVVALRSTQPQLPCIRLVFVLGVSFLGFGTLITGIVVYSHARLYERQKKDYQRELETAITELRDVRDVYTEKKKLLILAEKGSLIFLFGGLFLLMLYSILSSFS